MVCHRMSSSKEKVQQLRLVGTGVGRWRWGMTSLMGPEVSRLFIDQGNNVPGRGSAGEKPLRWKERASVWKITEGPFSWGRESGRWNQRHRQGLMARSFISSLNLWDLSKVCEQVHSLIWVPLARSLWLQSEELACPGKMEVGRSGGGSCRVKEEDKAHGSLDCVGKCVLSLSVKQPPSEESHRQPWSAPGNTIYGPELGLPGHLPKGPPEMMVGSRIWHQQTVSQIQNFSLFQFSFNPSGSLLATKFLKAYNRGLESGMQWFQGHTR